MLLISKYHYAVTTTVGDAPFRQHNLLDYLIANHSRVLSIIADLLVIVGGIVFLPGFSALVNGMVLAHPGVTFAGAIAVVVGKWLRSKLDSAAARAAEQVGPRSQEVIEDVNGGRRERTERDPLLFVEGIV
jgi:hypothetical protein